MPFAVFMVKNKRGVREEYFRATTDRINDVNYTWLSCTNGTGMLVLTAALADEDTYRPGEDRGLQRSEISDAQVRTLVTTRRVGEAAQDKDRNSGVKFKPLTEQQVTARLETQYLHEAVDGDDTARNTARRFLLHFVLRLQGTPPLTSYRFTLEANFVGETAHILGARVLNPTFRIGYVCATVGGMRPRFNALMVQLGLIWNAALDGYTTKTHINEHLIGPRTVKNPTKAHGDVLARILKPISVARRGEIADWVAGFFPDGDGDNPPRRAAIWVRNVDGDGHTTAQNLREARFKKILEALRVAEVQQVIIVGDGCPDAWLNHPSEDAPYFRMTGNRDTATAFNFSLIWTADGGPPDGEHSVAAQRRGYAEQAAVYVALYRTHGMACIIGNKSGGLDLPAFSGVPTVQLSEFVDGEIFVHHRLGFQSLCSPFWTVVPVTRPENPDAMTLSTPEKNTLVDAVRRTRGARTWHLGQLKTGKNSWKLVD